MKKTLPIFFCLLLLNCATTKGFIRLELGMTKEQVLKTIGEPELARGSIRNKYDQLIEVWEYYRLPDVWSSNSSKKTLWVYFCDGHLSQWGEAGDWKAEADKIYEVRFR